MKQKIIFVIILGFISCLIQGEKVGFLDGVMKPSIIDIFEERLFVMDAEKIRVYSLKDLTLLNTFGKKGEGPGEYKTIISIPLRLEAHKDYLLVESYDKLLYFTHNGKYLREQKKTFFLNLVTPIGNNFVGRRIVQPSDGSLSTSTVKIYNQNLAPIKELFQKPFLQQGSFPNLQLDLSQDFLLFCVHDNKIFLEKSNQGFVIDVFDFQGKKLYEINKPFEKIPITSSVKKKLIKDIELDPQVQRQLTQFGFKWEDFSKNFKFIFPEHFPPIRTMDIDNKRIYVKTFKKKDNNEEYIIMDLKGKILKKTFVPQTVKPWVMSLMMGIRLETIHNGKIYYIKENEDEEWELFVQEIK